MLRIEKEIGSSGAFFLSTRLRYVVDFFPVCTEELFLGMNIIQCGRY